LLLKKVDCLSWWISHGLFCFEHPCGIGYLTLILPVKRSRSSIKIKGELLTRLLLRWCVTSIRRYIMCGCFSSMISRNWCSLIWRIHSWMIRTCWYSKLTIFFIYKLENVYNVTSLAIGLLRNVVYIEKRIYGWFFFLIYRFLKQWAHSITSFKGD
jgi:hypothetical protein